MRTIATFIAAACLAIAGCGTAFRHAADEFERTQPPSAWGKAPPEGHHDVERRAVLAVLKDPASAMISSAGIARWVAPASATDPSPVPMWRSAISVNAKNAFGGYTGAQLWQAFWYDGELVSLVSPQGTVYRLRPAPPSGPVRR